MILIKFCNNYRKSNAISTYDTKKKIVGKKFLDIFFYILNEMQIAYILSCVTFYNSHFFIFCFFLLYRKTIYTILYSTIAQNKRKTPSSQTISYHIQAHLQTTHYQSCTI